MGTRFPGNYPVVIPEENDLAVIIQKGMLVLAKFNNIGYKNYESPIVPTLLNAWVNYGAPYGTVGYWKDPLGIVHLKGTIKGGLTRSIAFKLPDGYKPNANIIFASAGDGDTVGGDSTYTCIVSVSSEGYIIPSRNTDTMPGIIPMAMVNLENISFRAGV